jgi:HSP20 family protein
MANELDRWSSLKELDRFRRDIDDLFDRFLGGRAGSAFPMGTPFPALESVVENGKLVVRADLPGIDPNQVEVTVTGDMLTLRGKREQRHEAGNGNFIHREVSYGSFERSLKLPAGVKADEIKAAYRNGVLELTIPVTGEAGGRRIQVQVDSGKRIEHDRKDNA